MDGAEITVAIVEVISVKDMDKEIVKFLGSYFGTCFFIGAASAAGSALWTYVLRDKVSYTIWKIRRPKADNVIDFRKAKKRLSR